MSVQRTKSVDDADQSELRRAVQAPGAGRPAARGERPVAGTSGELLGTSGVRLALLVAATVVLAITTINIFSQWHDRPQIAAWEPVVWEYSSAVASIACLFVPLVAFRLVPPGFAPWPRVLLVHAAGSLVFSALHVALFVLLRHLAYALLGARYEFDATASEFFYEYRKDLLGYVGTVAGLWLAPRLLRRPNPHPAPEPPLERTYDIRDGARLIRAPLTEIVAITAAGNYVEFQLADGRRPLARATLAAVEAELGREGFVRTHRSWLVNVSRVREIEPAGSGDFALKLAAGPEAPLSRRYPEALEAIRKASVTKP